ncbi:hypothetical protein [Streptococcus gordonii]|uniref:hypothetical protein n=1 Tax=Streptococcus gordonii TaxID=1302 RepID=UPI0007798535|nr:hypothetical protein [Streptococcus gordonii]QBX16347.1 hypothetical protein Javan247_0028 [Streptococcus phage Javan247]HEQ4682284.1 hypothetical protein [Streptococcus pyogenes]
MKPKRRPYTGKIRIVRKEMPRFIMLSYTAFDSSLVDRIDTMVQTGINETLITFKIPRFFSYEEKQIRVPLPLIEVVKILNQY